MNSINKKSKPVESYRHLLLGVYDIETADDTTDGLYKKQKNLNLTLQYNGM